MLRDGFYWRALLKSRESPGLPPILEEGIRVEFRGKQLEKELSRQQGYKATRENILILSSCLRASAGKKPQLTNVCLIPEYYELHIQIWWNNGKQIIYSTYYIKHETLMLHFGKRFFKLKWHLFIATQKQLISFYSILE